MEYTCPPLRLSLQVRAPGSQHRENEDQGLLELPFSGLRVIKTRRKKKKKEQEKKASAAQLEKATNQCSGAAEKLLQREAKMC